MGVILSSEKLSFADIVFIASSGKIHTLIMSVKGRLLGANVQCTLLGMKFICKDLDLNKYH